MMIVWTADLVDLCDLIRFWTIHYYLGYIRLSQLRKVYELQSTKNYGFYFIDNQMYTPLGARVFPFRMQGKKRLIIKI